MSWLLAIGLALAGFALAAFVLRLPRPLWTLLAAALALGLAGYASQASPGRGGAPAQPPAGTETDGWAAVDARKQMLGTDKRQSTPKMLIGDALTRRGQHANAATMYRGAADENPRDAEAWIALGNALVDHAGGRLTEPAVLAFRRAAAADPGGAAPGYFFGLALIRQGQLLEGRAVWAETLRSTAAGSAGRPILSERLARLDALLRQIASPREEP